MSRGSQGRKEFILKGPAASAAIGMAKYGERLQYFHDCSAKNGGRKAMDVVHM